MAEDHSHSAHQEGFWRKYWFSTDHKVIGIQYGITAMLFLLFGFGLMLLMRWQLASPGVEIPLLGALTPEMYNQFGAMHGTIMVFLGIVPWLRGRVMFLFVVLLGEGVMLMLFSQMAVLVLAVGTMIVFSLFVQMSEGATFGIVPFINRKALGAVAGIVGAGGNAGAVAAGFLFRSESITMQQGLLYLGVMVAVASVATALVRFSPAVQDAEKKAFDAALAERQRLKADVIQSA